jgi:hypothetical protein
VRYAKKIHNSETSELTSVELRLGALVTAIEILARNASEQTDAHPATERQGRNGRASDTAPRQHGFDEDLVERLYVVFGDAMGTWRDGIRAIRAELAKMPVELPSADEIAQAWNREPSPVAPKANVLELVRSRLAPILAAKEAELSRLDEQTERDQLRIAELQTENAQLLDGQLSLVGEIESCAPANSCDDSARKQYEITIAQQLTKIAELEKRLAEKTAPIDADGKTPGQVSRDARREATLSRGVGFVEHEVYHGKPVDNATIEEEASRAVLRVFGKKMVQEALESLRGNIVIDDDPSGYFRGMIDAEIAKLEGLEAAPTSDKLGRFREAFIARICNIGAPLISGMPHVPLAEMYDAFDDELRKAGWNEPTSDQANAVTPTPAPKADHVQKRPKYGRAWLSEQTNDALFDLYMEHVGFFDMNGTMLERDNMIETLAAIEEDPVEFTIDPSKNARTL